MFGLRTIRTLPFLLAICTLVACPAPAHAAGDWQLYTTANGLSGNSTWFIDEDAQGYLWFTTAFSGATRFDGVRFEGFNSTRGLISNDIYSTLPDQDGGFWFATDRGLCRYAQGAFQCFDDSLEMAERTVNSMLADRNGDVWLATDRGAFRFEGSRFGLIPDASEDGEAEYTTILEDSRGDLWWGTTHGVRRYGGQRLLPVASATLNDRVDVLFEDESNTVWFGTRAGLFRWNHDASRAEGPFVEHGIIGMAQDARGVLWLATEFQGVFTHDPTDRSTRARSDIPADRVLSLHVDGRGHVWIGTDKGVYSHDGRRVHHFTEVDGTPISFVRSIVEDGDANLWFATEHGVCKYTIRSLQQYTVDNGLVANAVTCILEDRGGHLWMGSMRGAVQVDGDTLRAYTRGAGLVHGGVLTIFEDDKGAIWFGTTQGLQKDLHASRTEPWLGRTAVRAMLEDGQGNLWLASTEGLHKYDGTTLTSIPIPNGQLMMMDMTGALWVGSWDAGVYRIDGQGQLANFGLADGLSSNHVTWMMQTHDGSVWLGLKSTIAYGAESASTPGGVCRWDGRAFHSYGQEAGLPSELVTCATEDQDGNLWLGTDKGIAKTHGRNGEWFSEVETIRKEHGLISNYVKCMTLDRDGHLWLGTDRGVSKYDGRDFQNILLEDLLTLGFVEQIYQDQRGHIYFITTKNGVIRYEPTSRETLPRIHITDIEADQVYKSHEDDIQIPTPADLVTFAYKAISFNTRPENMRFSYRLAGHEHDWQPSTRDSRVHYANLGPGHYEFLVRAIDRELHYSDPPASVAITVYQPYYRSGFFIVLIVLAGSGGIAGVGYMAVQLRRQRRIAAQFREKLARGQEAERIQSAKMASLRQVIAGVAHEINNPIGAISSSDDVTDRAVGKVKDIVWHDYDTSHQNQQLEKTFSVLEDMSRVKHVAATKIASIVTSLRRFVRLDEAEWQVANIHDGIDSAINLMSTEFQGKAEIVRRYGEVPRVYCAPGSCNQVIMAILRNALESLTDKGTITIETGIEDGFLRIDISDTGRGIPEEDLGRVFDPGFTTKGVQVGVGLGLAICYDIVTQRHGGQIDITSLPGKGSTVTIRIPTSPPAAQCAEEENSS